MYSEILQEIGLSPNEAKIYETLLSTGETSATTISLHANVPRRNVYDTLNRLIQKGLVFRIFHSKEHIFQAVNPGKLLEVLKEKEKKLTTVLPRLHDLYEQDPPSEAAYIYKGIEGYKNYMRDMVRVGQDTYFMGAKGLWFTPGIDEMFLDEFKKTMEKKNLIYKTLYDPRIKTELPEVHISIGGEYKFLPDGYHTPGVVDIFGDYVVTFTSKGVGNFGEDGTVFVMINKDLADTYRTWFEMIWSLLPESK
jgi:sugar-specific transcriptional regulator TrmB